jgi:glycosyltransferase involved in cell wall biosynthesis
VLASGETRLSVTVADLSHARSEAVSRRMKLLLVTSFPPSRGDLNEYGYHLACSLRDEPTVDLAILADEIDSNDQAGIGEPPATNQGPDNQQISGFHIERCWRFNSLLNPLRLLTHIAKHKPDVVWFNIGFSTFARNPVAAFLSLTVPAFTRMAGIYTHITLHTIFERIDLADAGIRWPSLYRLAGRLATRLLLLSGDVSVLLPSFQADLIRDYGKSARVHYRPHGTFEGAARTRTRRADTGQRIILAFGYWGTYKRLETLLESMNAVSSAVPNAMLVVAGTNHPSTPGYLESLQQKYTGQAVRFHGYVPEGDLPSLFEISSVLVLPYSSAAGTSGVMHQACQYGLPIVATSIPEIQEIAEEEKVAVELYSPGDSHALANHLIRLLSSDELRHRYAEQNLSAAGLTPMSDVVSEYLGFFQQQISQTRMQVTK